MIWTDEDEERFNRWLEKKRLGEMARAHRVNCPQRRRDDVPVLEELSSEEFYTEDCCPKVP